MGANPAGLAISGATIYGTTSAGGANGDGIVFSLATTGGTPTTLAEFDGTNGSSPEGNLIFSNDTVYGTTFYGGAGGGGTIFSLVVPEPRLAALLVLSAALFLIGFQFFRRFFDRAPRPSPAPHDADAVVALAPGRDHQANCSY
jgi:uncharacterized repeat protein (TIGR03803 family)